MVMADPPSGAQVGALLSVSGLRLGEARNLELQDVDLNAAVMTIRGTKFGKSRLVPLHASTCKVLADYIKRRNRHWAKRPVSSYLFVSNWGNRLDGGDIHRTFYALSRQIGLRGASASHGPRIHDTFKLFHLSILFKASVSSHSTFRAVSLGKHEERIREMLLAKNPGQAGEYPILAFAVLGAQGEVERRIISQPIAARYEGHHVNGQIYGGAMWWISTSSHRNIAFSSGGLQQSGDMTFIAEPWSEIGVMQDASVALKRKYVEPCGPPDAAR